VEQVVLVILLQQILLKEIMEQLEQVDMYQVVVAVVVLVVLVVLLLFQLLYLDLPQTVDQEELEHQTQLQEQQLYTLVVEVVVFSMITLMVVNLELQDLVVVQFLEQQVQITQVVEVVEVFIKQQIHLRILLDIELVEQVVQVS
tara:strand:+ start:201 stop:632 length:432 start_codon:yes stop_codon:yes gene_type:complete